jgi:phosphatidylglycerophosphate synthase
MNKNLNPANLVTAIRLVIGVFALINFIYSGLNWINGTLFLLFVILDGVDGYLARKLKCETSFGKNFDFITDGLIAFSLAIYLLFIGVIPILYAVLISVPVLFMLIGVWLGIKIKKNTFINGDWKDWNGFALFLTLVLFVINHKYSLIGVYLILVFFYISYSKFLYDMIKLERNQKHS